jgi:hypothetical protein
MREWFRCAGPVVFGLVVFAMPGSVALAASPLDGTQWNIQMTAPSAPTAPAGQIHFKKGKFASPFEPKGFAPSNYTLTEQDGAPLVWETMQTSATEGTLSWHGELGGDTMRGVASWQKADGTVVTYTFTAKKVGEAPRAATPKPEEPRAAKPAPEAPSAVKPKAEEPRATGAKPEEPRAAKPKPKPKSKPKAPVQSKPE